MHGVGHATAPGIGGELWHPGSGISEHLRTIHEHLGSSDTIISHVPEALRKFGAKVSNHNILQLTKDILRDNHLTWESAHHLPSGFKFIINLPAWLK
jgi:hypothetical protein